ncbi:stress-responsive transcription factor [Martiniozyma asiatica (nom. inval.)]|nr:stress-responsive transcription factor [Martiniozyma asiatica]
MSNHDEPNELLNDQIPLMFDEFGPSDLTVADSTFKCSKKKSTPAKRPAFVIKLWNMVNDSSNAKYITWLPSGTIFQVVDREGFMKHVLPKYFKHNNFASFVRQLNMYGWHKVQDVNSGALHGEEIWQFENHNFIRDKEYLLDNIVRNKPKDDDEVDIKGLLGQLEQMKKNQRLIAEDLRRVRQDNEMLWKENFLAREKHKLQSETLDKILRFLASVYGNNTTKLLDQVNNMDLMQPVPPRDYPRDPRDYSRDPRDYPRDPRDYSRDPRDYPRDPRDYPRDPRDYPRDYSRDYYYDNSSQQQQQQQQQNRLLITQRAHDGSIPSTSPLASVGELKMPHIQSASSSEINDTPIQEIRRGPENRNIDYHYEPPIAIQNRFGGPLQRDKLRVYQSAPGTPVGELVMGNINQHLDDNESTINQVNDWINKYGNEGLDSDLNLGTPLLNNGTSLAHTGTPLVGTAPLDLGSTLDLNSVAPTPLELGTVPASIDLNSNPESLQLENTPLGNGLSLHEPFIPPVGYDPLRLPPALNGKRRGSGLSNSSNVKRYKR